MREILFRGKRTYSGEWAYGYLLTVELETWSKVEKQKYTHLIAEPNAEFYRGEIGGFDWVIPETVGQYTGLTDRNGKKIFEGDILKYGDKIGYVMYTVGCFSVKDIHTQNRPAIDIIMVEFNVEIIGNIHDNPELLT